MRARLPALIFTILALTGCQPATEPDKQQSFIEVSGQGEVKVVPDVFPVRAEFVLVGKDIAAMKRALDDRIASLLATLTGLGVAEKDLRASDLQVQPQWQWQPERKLLGQRVSRSLEVRLHGMTLYTQVLGVLSEAGPDQLQPLGSELADTSDARHQALTLALRDARRRAAVLADEAGRELGTVVLITEQGHDAVRPMAMMAMEDMSSGKAYAAGEQTVSASVLARFELH